MSERCEAEEPLMRSLGDDRYVACHHPHGEDGRVQAVASLFEIDFTPRLR